VDCRCPRSARPPVSSGLTNFPHRATGLTGVRYSTRDERTTTLLRDGGARLCAVLRASVKLPLIGARTVRGVRRLSGGAHMKPKKPPAAFDPVRVSRAARQYQLTESAAGREVTFGAAIAFVMRQSCGGVILRSATGKRLAFDEAKFHQAVAEYNNAQLRLRRTKNRNPSGI
jgi:hypothetical protein